MRATTLLLLLSTVLASPALAEIYKCLGPDGKTLYTTDRSQCPGSNAHDLKGQVQAVESARRAPPRRRAPAGSPSLEAAQRAGWQTKKQTAEATVSEGQVRLRYLVRMVTACNRGAELYIEDDDTGIRRGYSCDQVKTERVEVAQAVKQAEHYLAEGLEEECRRSGCLPGWIR